MSGTRLNKGEDMDIREDEHKLLELDYAIKVIREMKYSVYTPSDVVEMLKKILPYTTVERVNGLKATAEAAAKEQRDFTAEQKQMIDGLVHRVQSYEGDIDFLKSDIDMHEKQYSRLKERFSQVKTENQNLRQNLCKMAEKLAWLDEHYDAARKILAKDKVAMDAMREQIKKLKGGK